MSAFHESALAIAVRLQAEPVLSCVDIIVDQQKDIASELRKSINKQTGGGMLIVAWTGAKNEDDSADGPTFVSNYTVTLFAKPVLRSGELPADDIMEKVASILHDFRPNSGHYHSRLIVKGIEPVPNDELLIYQLSLTTPSQM